MRKRRSKKAVGCWWRSTERRTASPPFKRRSRSRLTTGKPIFFWGSPTWVSENGAMRRSHSRAISFNDGLRPAYLALGSSLLEQGKYPEAEQRLVKGLDLTPEAP